MLVVEQGTRQDGAISTSQLLGAGLTPKQIRTRVRDGRLHPKHRGVYAVGRPELDERGRIRAALLAIGEDAVAADLAAAWLHGAWPFKRRLGEVMDVAVPRKVASRPGIRVHSASAWSHRCWTRRGGIPVLTPVETLFGIAARHPGLLRPIARELVIQRRVSRPELERAVRARPGRHGCARLRALVGGEELRLRTELEALLASFLTERGFTGWEPNARIGRWEVDVVFPGSMLVVEADGRFVHDNWLSTQDDERKQSELEALGYRVLRVRWEHLTRRPEQTEQRIRRAL